MFYPPDASVPTELRTDKILLRPLRASDAVLDYDAVMSSRTDLLLHSAGSWPREDFTLAENLADLQMHEQEHLDRVAFTYTVMNLTETECLGCVYIRPFELIRKRLGASSEQSNFPQAYVSFWVRSSRVADNLDRHLLQTLISWFRTSWAFERLAFMALNEQKRQQHILQDVGLQLAYQLPKAALYGPRI